MSICESTIICHIAEAATGQHVCRKEVSKRIQVNMLATTQLLACVATDGCNVSAVITHTIIGRGMHRTNLRLALPLLDLIADAAQLPATQAPVAARMRRCHETFYRVSPTMSALRQSSYKLLQHWLVVGRKLMATVDISIDPTLRNDWQN